MPYKPSRPCRYRDCNELTTDKSGFCDMHRKQRFKELDSHRGTPSQRGYDNKWTKARATYLRANPLCVQCHKEDRIIVADCVDHIIPHKGDMSRFWDTDNWQSLCDNCHRVKTMKEMNMDKKGLTRPTITIISGPPGAGKTSYAKQHMASGDLILDLDMLIQALTGLEYYDKPLSILPYAIAANNAVLLELEKPHELYRAWVIAGLPRYEERNNLARRLNAKVKMLEVSENECIARIMNDKRRIDKAHLWREIIQKWWHDYQSREEDEIIK